MKLSRRKLLLWGMAAPWLQAVARAALAPASRLESFMELSRAATGFSKLDESLGRHYLPALLAWEPALADLLAAWSRRPELNKLSADQFAVVDLVIRAWYTGAAPTERGTRVVSFAGALGWSCMGRRTPQTMCRG
jgi:hypothetical protein